MLKNIYENNRCLEYSLFYTPYKTYIFGLLLQHQLHPLLPEVKKVHDGTEDSQSPLFLWNCGTTTIINIDLKINLDWLKIDAYLVLEGHLVRNRTLDTWVETAT